MLGRVVKTIYILKYLNEEDLRHRVQLQLNRGERRHSLARWIFFADQGEFRTGDYQEIMNKASCLSLVSNAILVWNTLQIARILETLRQTGTPVAVEDLARVSLFSAARILEVLSADLDYGARVVLEAIGPDEQEALNQLEALLLRLRDEEGGAQGKLRLARGGLVGIGFVAWNIE
jgi:phosphotransferase system HPr-like phosphotransfer protein